MSRSRALIPLWLACALAAACTDGSGPTDNGRSVPLDLRPSFQVDPALFLADPVDRIRLVASDASTLVGVGMSDVAVSPSATQWTLSLGIDLGGASSRVVIVNVELFAGGVVQWSGRLGPITVHGGTAAPAQSVGLNRGPLSNLDVASLTITGAPTQLGVGSTAVLVANPTLISGSTVTPSVFWASTNASVATVIGAGLAATVTGVSAGSVGIVASAGTSHAEATIEVRSVAPPGFDLEWRGTTTDWSTAANWSTGQVPQPTDRVYIPASSLDPTITSPVDVTVANLTVASGATLTAANTTLTLTGSLEATGPISGSAIVRMIGTSTVVGGTIETTLSVSGTAAVAPSSSLSVANLAITGTGTSLDVNGRNVSVAGTLVTQNGGVLRMTATGGVVSTLDASFFGGSTAGLLTAGELRVRGDFVTLADAQAFVGTGTHTVVFDGSTAQSVSFSAPTPTQQRFQNVRFDNPGDVSFSSGFVATGAVNVVRGSASAGQYVVYVGGSLVDPSGGLSYASLHLIGDVTALPPSLRGPVSVGASVGWPNSVTLTGDLDVLGSLDVGANTLTVTGQVNATADVTVPLGGTLALGGTLFLASGLTFNVGGTVTAAGGCENAGATIVGAGTQPCGGLAPGSKVWVGGDAGGPNDWHIAPNWSPGGVPGSSDDVLVPAGASITLTQAATVASVTLQDNATLDLGAFDLTVSGDLDAANATVFNGVTRLSGAGTVLRGNFGGLELMAGRSLSGTVVTSGTVTVSDVDLDVAGQALLIGGGLTVTGPAAHLVMTQPSSAVQVVAATTFDGGSHEGLLTDGALVVYGTFQVTDRSSTGFAASGAHTLELAGNGAQTASFALPGPTQQRIGNLVIGGALSKTFSTSATVTGDALVIGALTIPVSVSLSIGGSLQLYPGSTLTVNGAVTASAGCQSFGGQILGTGTHPCPTPPANDRAWVGGDATGGVNAWENPANWVPTGVPTASERIYIPYSTHAPVMSSNQSIGALSMDVTAVVDLGGNTLSVAGDLEAAGYVTNGLVDVTGPGTQLFGILPSVRISSSRGLTGYLYAYGHMEVRALLAFDLGGVFVEGDFQVSTAQGAIELGNSDNSLTVLGNTTFDGADSNGLLKDGNISALGDFTVLGTHSPQAFRSTGTEVYLSASGDQTIKLSNPAGQSFFDLYVTTSSGAVILASDVMVTNIFSASATTLRRAASTASVLQLTGTLFAFQVTFDGLPVRLVTAAGPDFHTLSQSTFTNMPTDVAQLHIELPGGGAGVPFIVDAPVFKTVPGANGRYLQAFNTSPTRAQLVVHVQSPTPGTVLPAEISADALTSIVWPYP